MKGVPICCLVNLQELDSSFCCMEKVEHRMLAAVVSAKPTYSVVISQPQNLSYYSVCSGVYVDTLGIR